MDYVIVDSARENILWGPEECDFEYARKVKNTYGWEGQIFPATDPCIIPLFIPQIYIMLKEVYNGLRDHNLI